ncbi:MAG: hypothetical protein ACJA0T_003160 [Colwellia sp.]
MGQSDAAKEEREMARENLENSYRIDTILFDLLSGHSEQ